MKSLLWIIDLPFVNRLHHGGLLRYFSLSRELVRQGYTVTFAVNRIGDRQRCIEWLDELRGQRYFTNYCEIAIEPNQKEWGRLATYLLPFRLHGLAMRSFMAKTSAAINSALARYPADVIIVSSRRLLFVLQPDQARPCIGDFVDSITLHSWRSLAHRLGWRQLLDFMQYFFLELYSSRRYTACVLASRVDKRIFDWIGKPARNVCIENGVRGGPAGGSVSKIPYQIIFSGAMDFPPNYEGATWFLDRVFPLVLQRLPQATFLIAGANPSPDLLKRTCGNIKVSGFVEDLSLAIAQSALYIAPLVTGSGFKNKVVESLTSGTYVIGTRLATEFLEPEIREIMTVADNPQEMADAICQFLSHPERFDERLDRLRQIVSERYSWPAKASELARLVESLTPELAATVVNG